MRSPNRTSIRTAALAAALATAVAAPAAAQARTPREIAANARPSLLVVRALGADGDTVGLGTGFVISPDGMFVTNYHVIEEASKLAVESLDGLRFDRVSLVNADPVHDVAVLKVTGHNMHALRLGQDGLAEIGDRVYVMGNPLGMEGTFSDGLISGLRPVEGVSMLQISAPISPGSSGGPVMNERGEVIGVATMMVMGGQNLNMAVPARYLRPMVAARAEPRPFSSALLVSNPSGGLAMVGDHPAHPSERLERRAAGPNAAAASADGEVSAQLAQIRPLLAMRGFAPAFPIATGHAAQGGGETFEFQLEKGVGYVVTARCDNDCHDVDVGIFDGSNHLLAADTDDDDIPTLGFTPAETGTYRVTVRMAQCSSEPCAFGLAVFSRRQPSPVQVQASR
jgi:S1-C subfamily serine protease